MNRRNFLKLFASAAPVAAVAPKYFFAPLGGWHSEVIANPFNATPFGYNAVGGVLSAELVRRMARRLEVQAAFESRLFMRGAMLINVVSELEGGPQWT